MSFVLSGGPIRDHISGFPIADRGRRVTSRINRSNDSVKVEVKRENGEAESRGRRENERQADERNDESKWGNLLLNNSYEECLHCRAVDYLYIAAAEPREHLFLIN